MRGRTPRSTRTKKTYPYTTLFRSAGISDYQGGSHILDPEPLRDPTINYIVLAVAFLLEGTSWAIAVREFDAGRGGLGWWQAVRRSKDPAGFIVLFEDSAALAGLIIAAAGIWLSHATGEIGRAHV